MTQKKVEIDPATGKEKVVGVKKETVSHPDANAQPTPVGTADAKKLAPDAKKATTTTTGADPNKK